MVVTEMCNTLPHMDRRVIEEYLAEAGGDQMVAITLAMSQLKRPTTTAQPMYHHCWTSNIYIIYTLLHTFCVLSAVCLYDVIDVCIDLSMNYDVVK